MEEGGNEIALNFIFAGGYRGRIYVKVKNSDKYSNIEAWIRNETIKKEKIPEESNEAIE